MAELNDKLITYGNLSTFYDKLQEQGLGGNAIENVSVLPDASANKNKFVRLASDKKVYVSECTPTTSEVNAPDAQQIDNAYLDFIESGGISYIYRGESYITDGEQTIKAYRWGDNSDSTMNIFTNIPAEEITSLDDSNAFAYSQNDDWYLKPGETNVYQDLSGWEVVALNSIDLDSIYLVKSTVTIETWAWKTLDYQPMQSITYAELKALRDNKQLIPGQQYRITDYVTTTAQANTQSAGHQFDIIVVADSEDKLNENARAINHIFDTSGATTYYKWLYDITGESWLLSDASSYTNQVAGTCDISPMDGYDYYTTSYPIIGTIDENGDEPYTPGSLYRKAILFTEGDTLYYGDYIDEETWNSWEESKQENDPSYTPQPYPEWFIGKYFLDEGDLFTYDGTYTEGVDTYFDNSKLDAWELKYCLDNDTNRFTWAQEGGVKYAAIRSDYFGYDETTFLFVRYPEGDGLHTGLYENYFQTAWALVNNSENLSIDNTDVDWTDIDTTKLLYTNNVDVITIDAITVIDNEDWEGAVWELTNNREAVIIPAGKGVIYYMKDEFNNQVYFDFKNIMIYSEDYGDDAYLFGDNENGYYWVDSTLDGSSNNNIVEGEVTDGVLTLDTDTLLWNQTGYQNIAKYTAGTNVQINGNVISATDTKYTLPTASSNTLGGVKVGNGLYINNGVLSANIYNAGEGIDVSNNIISIQEEIMDYLIDIFTTNYNSLQPNQKYLTIEATQDNTDVTLSKVGDQFNNKVNINIEVSKNLVSWNKFTVKSGYTVTLATLNTGEKLYIRGDNATFGNGMGYDIYHKFYNTKPCYYYGNIMSLLQRKNFGSLNYFPSNYDNGIFYSLFKDNDNLLIDENNKLLLPATILNNVCYRRMFYGCTSLTTAPDLPATSQLTASCYRDMFNGCTNLNYIKCLTSDTNYGQTLSTQNWVNGVSSTGTFITPSSTNWSTGVNGIPSGWTRVDSDAVSNA